ncbi:uncharacterized protein LOC134004815 [Scomber scombrus]|uniref:uncharacterized protein LOC134004815 n=1 Tax=Scomber scombrus TaxID=13677 RepID=UPI002DDB98F5|nr:uncharacterized protein LOC134004815 [Scomber scombrus]
MDNTYKSKQNGGYSNLSSLFLLLFLAGLQPALSTHTDQPEPGLQIEFLGLGYATVGVPSSIGCQVSNCPACTYSMSMDEQKVQGNVLSFTLNSWVKTLTVSCTATDVETKLSAIATTSLQGLAGPANVSITGPGVMNPTVSHTYSCHANCRPSCFYAWKLNQGPWIRGQGNVISVTAQEMHSLSTLNCKATNTISRLFVSATKTINVTCKSRVSLLVE